MATKTAELKDAFGGDVLAAEGHMGESEQSGETFCWEADEDVIDDEFRYEYFEDLYPEVRLRTIGREDDTYLPVTAREEILDTRPAHEILNYRLGDAAEQLAGIRAINHVVPIYEFTADVLSSRAHLPGGIGIPTRLSLPGTLEAKSETINVADMWERDASEGSLPTFASFSVTFNVRHLGGSEFWHNLLSAVHPIQHTLLPGLTPPRPAYDGFIWPRVMAESFTFAGDGNRHVTSRANYAPTASVGGGYIGAHAGAATVAFGRGAQLNIRGRSGVPMSVRRDRWAARRFYRLRRFAHIFGPGGHAGGQPIRWIASRAAPVVAVPASAHVAASFGVAAAGHDVAEVSVTPYDSNGFAYEASRIRLVVD